MTFFNSENSLFNLEVTRLKSFDGWPNDRNWKCTPEKLAKAGFYFKPEGDCLDNACCAFCRKELDGWEPDDDPLAEHLKHSPKCPFLSLLIPVEDLPLDEYVRFIAKVDRFVVEQEIERVMRTINEMSQAVEETMRSHVNSS